MTYTVAFYAASRALGETSWPGNEETARRHVVAHMASAGATRATIHDAAGALVFEHGGVGSSTR